MFDEGKTLRISKDEVVAASSLIHISQEHSNSNIYKYIIINSKTKTTFYKLTEKKLKIIQYQINKYNV